MTNNFYLLRFLHLISIIKFGDQNKKPFEQIFFSEIFLKVLNPFEHLLKFTHNKTKKGNSFNKHHSEYCSFFDTYGIITKS